MPVELLSPQRPRWQQQLADSIKSAAELLKTLELPLSMLADAQNFPVRVPKAYVDKIQPGDPHDPLLLQVLPMLAESNSVAGFSHDPVGDLAAVRHRGLLQKYHGRALVMTTPACAIHCRYCFRRHFPYTDHSSRQSDWQPIVDAVQADNTLHEIILSGGDPLSLSNSQLAHLCQNLAEIPHLKRLRIHSRLPVVLPDRIDEVFTELFAALPVQVCMVIHCNHSNEVDHNARLALEKMRRANITLLNQAVLLRRINDDIDTQVALSETLFDAGVLPYYLHLLDRVHGAAHFEVTEQCARELRIELQQRLPGYLVPRFVREESGSSYKTPLA